VCWRTGSNWIHNTMDKVRIGIVGSGFMGRTNAETVVRYLDHAQLIAITGGSRAAALAQEYGVSCEASVEALVSRRDIDAVLISTPHCDHAEQAIAAASHGKHVLLDKPMAVSVKECDRILEAVRAAGVKLMIMFGQRFRTCNIEAHRLIRDGAIGKVRMIFEREERRRGIDYGPALPEQWCDGDDLGIVEHCGSRLSKKRFRRMGRR